jgi:hypothetical protein
MNARLFKKVVPRQDVQVGDLLWYDQPVPASQQQLVLVLALGRRRSTPFSCLVLYSWGVGNRRCLEAHFQEFSFDGGPIYAFVDKGDK